MSKNVQRDDLVVAKLQGAGLYLARDNPRGVVYQPLGERTIFFSRESADDELSRMHIDPMQVNLVGSSLSIHVG